MQQFRRLGYGLIALALCAVAGSALAVSPVKKKPLPLPIPVAHIAKPPVTASVRPVPKLAFRAPQPKLPPPAVGQHVMHTPPAAPAAAAADKPTLLAQSGDWSAFRATSDGAPTCYSATQPKDTEPSQHGRSPVYFYLTSYSPGSIKHELTVKLGLAAPANGATANVDGQDFHLITKSGVAYPPDDRTQQDLLQAMRRGHTLLLKTGINAGVVTDSFSLLGVEDSMRASDAACSDKNAATESDAQNPQPGAPKP